MLLFLIFFRFYDKKNQHKFMDKQKQARKRKLQTKLIAISCVNNID